MYDIAYLNATIVCGGRAVTLLIFIISSCILIIYYISNICC